MRWSRNDLLKSKKKKEEQEEGQGFQYTHNVVIELIVD
jgi:hypothetical protein